MHEYSNPENGIKDKANAHSHYGDYGNSEAGDNLFNGKKQGLLCLVGDEFVIVFPYQPNDQWKDEGRKNPRM